MKFTYTGKAVKLGDNIDTDVIIPARYLVTFDLVELGKHVFEGIEENFRVKLSKESIIVAGENFGCGSSREHAPLAIKGASVSCVIAKSFARIFYRNAVNVALPIIESPEAYEGIDEGDEIFIDVNEGVIKNLTKDRIFNFKPFPPFIREIIEADGLINYVKRRLKG